MKFEYITTIVHLGDAKVPMIKVTPPDDTGWSLLSMVTSPNGLQLYYNWAKQKPLVQFNSSNEDFEKSCTLIKDEPDQK